ncbi:DUF7742 family protein [Sulfitobacter sp.]|uniref:DUF7742 family protein n=1 Tax=Sulfitobacter sp. TaxID=1903071 RepID=UPI0030038002
MSDLHHAAGAVQTVPVGARVAFCQRLFWQAHVADKHVKRLRRLHPQWGDGSLRAATLAHLKGYSMVNAVPDYYLAMALVLNVLARRGDDRCGTCTR